MGTNATDVKTTFDALRALLEQDAGDVADLPKAWDQTRSLFIALDDKWLSGRLFTELRDAQNLNNVRSLLSRDDNYQSAFDAYRTATARYNAVWDVHARLNDKAEADEISYSKADEYRETNCLDATEQAFSAAQELLNMLGYGSAPGQQRPETPMPCCDSDEDWLHRRDPAEFDGDGDFRYSDSPEDISHDNLRRAGFALIAAQAFATRTGADRECVLCDLLCDLMHLADATGQDFDAELDRGRYHYDAERQGEP